MKILTLESQLIRSALSLLVWMSGLLSAIIVALLLINIINEQTPAGNREVLDIIAAESVELRDMLRQSNPAQTKIMLNWIRAEGLGISPTEEDLLSFILPNLTKRFDGVDMVQWASAGRRNNPEGKALGAVPAHWLAALKANPVVIISEPQGSIILQGPLKVFGAETLLMTIDPDHTLAVISPTQPFSNREIGAYAVLWVLLLWVLFLILFVVLSFPLIYLMARRQAKHIAAPLKQLSAAAEMLKRGESSAAVVPGGSSETISLAHSFNEMTRSWALARQDEQSARSQLEQAISQQRQFVSDVSHDLRTPLTAVMGYTERALRRSPNDADLTVIAREAEAMKALVNNLFEIAQNDSQESHIVKTPVVVLPLLTELVDSFATQAWAKGVLLRAAPDLMASDDRQTALMDRARMALALRNLIDNAVQHTEQGGLVELGYDIKDSELTISVSDTGAGIAPEVLPHIFKRGVRGDNARTRRGGGLGLAIVKVIVEQHGGSVAVDSELGQGSLFRIKLKIDA